jgi:hypothetical protein
MSESRGLQEERFAAAAAFPTPVADSDRVAERFEFLAPPSAGSPSAISHVDQAASSDIDSAYGTRCHALIVDDNPINIKVCSVPLSPRIPQAYSFRFSLGSCANWVGRMTLPLMVWLQ